MALQDIDLEPTLTGARVTLAPLQAADRNALLAASSDGELWKLKVTSPPGPETVDAYIASALRGRDEGSMIPFKTMVGDEIVGCTRFWRIDRVNLKAEIGHTWIAQSWQRSFVNTEAKLLMLGHAFETLGLIRVQFQTDELNRASRTAILRLGAVEEGLLRNERIMPGGRRRNTVCYSIIDSEWPAVRARLMARLA
jgi:RimJ/RimL family protein N-acetyltransferase